MNIITMLGQLRKKFPKDEIFIRQNYNSYTHIDKFVIEYSLNLFRDTITGVFERIILSGLTYKELQTEVDKLLEK